MKFGFERLFPNESSLPGLVFIIGALISKFFGKPERIRARAWMTKVYPWTKMAIIGSASPLSQGEHI